MRAVNIGIDSKAESSMASWVELVLEVALVAELGGERELTRGGPKRDAAHELGQQAAGIDVGGDAGARRRSARRGCAGAEGGEAGGGRGAEEAPPGPRAGGVREWRRRRNADRGYGRWVHEPGLDTAHWRPPVGRRVAEAAAGAHTSRSW